VLGLCLSDDDRIGKFLIRSESYLDKKQILVVEDEQIVARDLKRLLTKLGYVALGPVTSGLDAIQVAAEKLPDLVLMDIRLEGPMDGVEASAQIFSHRQVPIIYLTAFPETFIREPLGMVYPFLCAAKPYSDNGLEAIIQSVLGVSPSRVN
jgi:CheY-like chemotaxis protein